MFSIGLILVVHHLTQLPGKSLIEEERILERKVLSERDFERLLKSSRTKQSISVDVSLDVKHQRMYRILSVGSMTGIPYQRILILSSAVKGKHRYYTAVGDLTTIYHGHIKAEFVKKGPAAYLEIKGADNDDLEFKLNLMFTPC